MSVGTYFTLIIACVIPSLLIVLLMWKYKSRLIKDLNWELRIKQQYNNELVERITRDSIDNMNKHSALCAEIRAHKEEIDRLQKIIVDKHYPKI